MPTRHLLSTGVVGVPEPYPSTCLALPASAHQSMLKRLPPPYIALCHLGGRRGKAGNSLSREGKMGPCRDAWKTPFPPKQTQSIKSESNQSRRKYSRALLAPPGLTPEMLASILHPQYSLMCRALRCTATVGCHPGVRHTAPLVASVGVPRHLRVRPPGARGCGHCVR